MNNDFFQGIRESYLESYGGSRSEPAAVCGLRKQVTEAKEGLVEFRREKGRGKAPGRKRGKGKLQACSREGQSAHKDVLKTTGYLLEMTKPIHYFENWTKGRIKDYPAFPM